ncbi:MAG: hypothetical protein IKO55_15625, partial [Kiritimatiellae bacterium]|nr:hypothetical protein [Kiritimatiellia bacterium]
MDRLFRTDLADEARRLFTPSGDEPLPGVRTGEETLCGLRTVRVEIRDAAGARALRKAEGLYFSLELPRWFDRGAESFPDAVHALAALIRRCLRAAPERVLECETEAQSITLTRGAADGWQAITVNLAYTGDTADFSTLPSTVEFAVGETEKSVSFSMVDNAASDGNRTLVVAIAAGSNYVAGAAASASILVVDDETAAQVCEWTGGGNGTDWSDPNNWSTHAVPTKIDTALFGSDVLANLTVTMPENAVAKLIRITTANDVSLGAAATPSINAIDVEVAEGAGTFRYATTFAIGTTFTMTVATNATAVVNNITGTGDMVKRGPGRLVFGSDANRTGGTTYLEAGRIEFGGNKNLFGTKIVVGGEGE